MQTLTDTSAWHQPASYEQFECIGARCEDTCCGGMSVSVDEQTFANYQACSDPVLKPRLEQFVTIRTEPTAEQFASIQLENLHCPFLVEQLCSIQQKLGADKLSRVCATYPRLMNVGEGYQERSLDLSCPEAARLVLNNAAPMQFVRANTEANTAGPQRQASKAPFYHEIRQLVFTILQNRRYSIEQRLLLLGHVSGKLSEVLQCGAQETVPEVLGGFELAIDAGLFDAHLQQHKSNPLAQLAISLELIVGRIQLDFTAQRFLDIYNEFTLGLKLQPESTLEELAANYTYSRHNSYGKFVADHQYILENYLVSYAYKALFPFGLTPVNATLPATSSGFFVQENYLLMVAYYSVTRTLMTGMAEQCAGGFGIAEATRVIQACTRTLEHCASYPKLVLDLLMSRELRTAASIAVLI